MKTTLAVFLAMLGWAHAEPARYNLEIRVLASANPTDELRISEFKDNPQYAVYSLPKIQLTVGEKKTVSLSAAQRLSPHPTGDTSERCELILTSEKGNTFKIKCEWLVSHKKGDSVTTEHRDYSRTLSPGKWDFSHYAQEDAQGRERYLGLRLGE